MQNNETKPNTEEIFSQCLERAEQGDAESQYKLGLMYYNGEGTEVDKEKALYWYTKAAEQGVVKAQTRLGCMYADEEAPPVDKKQKLEQYTKDAEQGHMHHQWLLGYVYDIGKLVAHLPWTSDESKAPTITVDKENALYWYTKAAEQDHVVAQYRLAQMYEHGDGIAIDKEKAFYWYTTLAERSWDSTGWEKLGAVYYALAGMYMRGETPLLIRKKRFTGAQRLQRKAMQKRNTCLQLCIAMVLEQALTSRRCVIGTQEPLFKIMPKRNFNLGSSIIEERAAMPIKKSLCIGGRRPPNKIMPKHEPLLRGMNKKQNNTIPLE
ncbi:tetratricopeptide repeat protein [Treponema phagedenis]|uniref:tetratricopeptide repeat protein n=1 Tax=Treponema phagedenis TaxID=162 RepID=UPI000466BFD7|nr:tetratricopeptide repeat protein [Treponema phagedenis]QSH95232.1 sel1 repeat family protein [Treponema phagedenis]